jgi:hypothetical protein
MANKSYTIMLNSKDSIYGTIENKSAKKMCDDFTSGSTDSKVYQDTEGYFAVDLKNVSAILINEIQKPKSRKIGF